MNITHPGLPDYTGPWTVLNIGPIGSRGAILTYKRREDFEEVMTGCFRGTLDELAAEVTETHGDNDHGKAYRLAIAFIRQMVKQGATS